MSCSSTGKAATRWTIFGLSILAIILAIVVVSTCKFLYASTDEIGLGIFSFEDIDGDCVAYLNVEGSGAHKAASAFSILAVVTTALATIGFSVLLFCLRENKKPVWITVNILYIVAALCQVLSFTLFGDPTCGEVRCTPGTGAIVAAINTCFLVAICVMAWMVPPPDNPVIKQCCCDEADMAVDPKSTVAPASKSAPPEMAMGESVNTTVVKNPDGSIVTTKEVLHADGTKTITRTIEASTTGIEPDEFDNV